MANITPHDSDVLIVLGTHVRDNGEPSSVLERRLQTAATYLRAHPKTTCIVTGGRTGRATITEAACMAAWLERAGIDPVRIISEDKALTTAQNLANARRLLFSPPSSPVPSGDAVDEKNEPSPLRVGLVTSDFHCPRACRIARAQGFGNICALAAPTPMPALAYNVVRELVCFAIDAINGNL